MFRRISLVLVAVLLTAPALAEDETCYVCGEDAECTESTVANFARDSCESRDICAQGQCVTICTTGSGECAIESPDDDGGFTGWPWPWNTPDFANTLVFAAHPTATETVSDAFESMAVGVIASQRLLGRNVGESQGRIAFENGKSFAFSRRVEVTRDGLVTASYSLEGHPELSRVIVESPSRGADVFVTVDGIEGRRFEAFTFDLFGSPDPSTAGRAPGSDR